jgi:hypothetical protein
MMKRILIALLAAGCLVGCSTQRAPVPMDVTAIPVAPAPDHSFTPEKVIELKNRLDDLRVGMAMDKVMQILDLPSLGSRSYANATSTGISYHFGNKYTLTLVTAPADYDAVLRWAEFDGAIWPKPHTPREPKQPPPPGAPTH